MHDDRTRMIKKCARVRQGPSQVKIRKEFLMKQNLSLSWRVTGERGAEGSPGNVQKNGARLSLGWTDI